MRELVGAVLNLHSLARVAEMASHRYPGVLHLRERDVANFLREL